jgi:hypothetical protein
LVVGESGSYVARVTERSFFPANYESLVSHFVISYKYHKPTTIQKSQKICLGVGRDSVNLSMLRLSCLAQYKSKRIAFIFIYIEGSDYR